MWLKPGLSNTAHYLSKLLVSTTSPTMLHVLPFFFKFLPSLFLRISSILSSHEILSLLLSPFILHIFFLQFDSHSFSLYNQTTSIYFFCTNCSFCIQSIFTQQSFIHNPISSGFYLVYISICSTFSWHTQLSFLCNKWAETYSYKHSFVLP